MRRGIISSVGVRVGITGNTGDSGAALGETGLQETLFASGADEKRITDLKEHALGTPEKRRDIIEALEKFAEMYADETRGNVAGRAISTILAVDMLEALHGD